MTTIACSKTEMAADSQEDDEGLIGRVDKIFKINGDLVGQWRLEPVQRRLCPSRVSGVPNLGLR